ncbi:zinc finger protein ZAT1-like [Mercurialis annua]|uniref:zinc finger protein ZAT1-like n=1 Tax=Mercurialis annua TaxID=3986 RepID=UPI0021605C82|nr:zinc finger protein ZAT1-like [Mercurialis annua]
MVMNMFVTDQTNNKIDHDTSTGVVDVGIELKDWPRELKKKRKHCYEDEINEPTTKKNKVVKLKEATGLVEPKRNVYQCKECKQDFDNFRALGGHMASHNRKMRSDDDLMNTSYKCPICHHVFNDFRALGGHIASHNRKDRAEKAALGGDSSLCIVAGSSVGSLRDKSYECNICYKKFLTGQALGGHKTYHRKIADSLIHAQENPEGKLRSNQVSSHPETRVKSSCGKVILFGIDLNASPSVARC